QIEKNQKELENISADKGAQKTKLAKINAQIDAIDSQINILNSRISLLGGQVTDLNSEISTLDSKIRKTKNQISTAESQIKERQKNIEETKALMIERLRANYMAGGASQIEILLSSSDLSTFYTRSEMLRQLAEKDQALVETLNAEMQQLDELTKSLAEDKLSLEADKSKVNSERTDVVNKQNDVKADARSLSSKQNQANSKYEQTQAILAKLDKSSAAYRDQIIKFEIEQDKMDKAIDEYIRTHASNTGDENDYENDGKMTWPVPYSGCYISSPFGYRTDPFSGNTKMHGGIDICIHGGSAGKKIVAAQSGKVISSGWGGIGGNTIIIDHGSGVTTLYCHASSLVAKEGEMVKKGDTIAYIGSTGNVTGPHLHFEVHINNGSSVNKVNPLKYVSIP
ncbi:MAG: peptidoglycan DD-metalloendopeptidase family protein, partial [Eubacteriales bacterium]